MLLAGCSTGRNVGVTNMEQPGPVIGRAVGSGVGAVAGTWPQPRGRGRGHKWRHPLAFDNTQRVVRYWREEKTTDGRIIFVPVDFLVNANGQVIRQIR